MTMIAQVMKNNNLSIYALSKQSGVPYTTINDICSGKAKIEKCTAETLFKLSRVLGVTMENLIEPYIINQERENFELFKSNICHRVKELGDIDFIISIFENNDINNYYNKGWYLESLYLLAMVDYLSRLNQIPLCKDYENLRKCKLEQPVYPSSILAMSIVSNNDNIKTEAYSNAIPEFVRFNIVESEIRNVI